MEQCFKFGFLPLNRTIRFDTGIFIPLDNIENDIASFRNSSSHDKYLYPPCQTTRTIPVNYPEHDDDREEFPISNYVSPLYKLPPSHELRLDTKAVGDNFQLHDGSFLMYLAGYLFGYRLQYDGWYFDGRINTESTHPVGYIADDRLNEFFSLSYEIWKSWPTETRIRFNNILLFTSRVPTYQWDFERFSINYMIFDACYKHANEIEKVKASTHRERIKTMCSHYGLHKDNDKIEKIADLRNDLFHEALWDKGQNITSPKDPSFILTEDLRRLNHRIIAALLKFPTTYIVSPWGHMGTYAF